MADRPALAVRSSSPQPRRPGGVEQATPGRAIQLFVDAISVLESFEVAADLRDRVTSLEAERASDQTDLSGGTVGSVDPMGFGHKPPGGRGRIARGGEPGIGEAGKQVGVDSCDMATKRGEGGVARDADVLLSEALTETGEDLVHDAGCAAQRGRRDQWPEGSEVLSAERCARAQCAQQVVGVDWGPVEAEHAQVQPRSPAGWVGWRVTPGLVGSTKTVVRPSVA